MVEQWAPFATKFDGPRDKHGYPGVPEPLPKLGAVYHSMEGSMSSALRELANPARRASWTFSNPKTGPLLQHYRLQEHTWTNGSFDSNIKFFSCENEGVAGERLTDSQVDNLVELTVFGYEQNGWTELTRQVTLWEHNEMTRFGATPTACPSDRIPWQEIIDGAQAILSPQEVEGMLAFWKTKDDGTVWLVNGYTRKAMHGERVEMAKALHIPNDVVEVSDDLLASLKEA